MADKETTSGKEKRLVIVGNAPVLTKGPIQPKVSAGFLNNFIDTSDIVIRMNEIKNRQSKGIGKRTDILAVMNCGQPKYTHGKRISRRLTKDLKEILFVVSDEEFEKMNLCTSENLNWGKRFTDDILNHQRWSNLHISYTDYSDMMDLEDMLNQQEDGERRNMASTGIRVIEHVLNKPRFNEYKIYLAGFGFKGWEGHNFDGERQYIESLLEKKCLHVPHEDADSVPKSKTRFRLSRLFGI